ncbi:MAG: hypothetical protein L0207_01890 [Chlamydiae bacterium]|nr:hypothetical protein [Chlamydiota bacterium]
MAASVPYHYDYPIVVRCYDHLILGLKRTIQKHEANWVEKIGNFGLWTIDRLPELIWEKCKDPRVITLLLTGSALTANSFLFYAEHSKAYIKKAMETLPLPEFWQVKFGSYVYTQMIIVSAAMRAWGRFSNDALMKEFYNPTNNNK